MRFRTKNRRAMVSWVSVGALGVLCAVLAILQYRWIGELSRAERERLSASLQSSLFRASQDFNSDITTACAALLPFGPDRDEDDVLAAISARYARWRETSRHEALFQAVGLAEVEDGRLTLHKLDLESGVFHTADWPATWTIFRDRFRARMEGEVRGGPPEGGRFDFGRPDEGMLIEIPRFRRPGGRPGGPMAPGPPRFEWLIVELNPQYVRNTLLPEIVQRHLGSGRALSYHVEVVTKTDPPQTIYESDASTRKQISEHADASVSLFEVQYERLFRRGGGREFRLRPPGAGEGGRWQMLVRHRSGSLEAVVARARWLNLGMVAGILVLMLATSAALLQFTRRAQHLAELQMQFVAGVSHELRTPLTVIRTAAYNLRGKLASNPAQVERYGALIQHESERLGTLVEQVMQFASAQAGHIIREREPVDIVAVLQEGLHSCKPVLDQAQAELETHIDPDLPPVLGDATSLKHAFQNLLGNAAKYGTEGNRWIGVFASSPGGGSEFVEIRVADHGPGIPREEQAHIFDPFYRGKRAVQDQIHGTGLGLSLVKGIVEAHGGTVAVHSEPMKGTEFVLRIPAAPSEHVDEFTNSISRG